MDEESAHDETLRVIRTIKRYPALWHDYKKPETEVVWNEVALVLGYPVGLLKQKWNGLYVRFQKEEEKRNSRSVLKNKWVYQEHMDFLRQKAPVVDVIDLDEYDEIEIEKVCHDAYLKFFPPMIREEGTDMRTDLETVTGLLNWLFPDISKIPVGKRLAFSHEFVLMLKRYAALKE